MTPTIKLASMKDYIFYWNFSTCCKSTVLWNGDHYECDACGKNLKAWETVPRKVAIQTY